jgi:hypothetical protein
MATAGAVTVTAAAAVFVVSATLTAVTLTFEGVGTPGGAVYSPLEETVPCVEFPPATPFTSQLTPVFGVPLTVEINCCVRDTSTDALPGDTDTETVATTVTPARPLWLVLLMAMIVVFAGLGGTDGAVYTPLFEIVPRIEFPPWMPFTLHVYVAGFLEPPPVCTTLNCVLWEVETLVAEGEIVKVGTITVTAACPDLDESATLVAAMVTIDDGTAAGAV